MPTPHLSTRELQPSDIELITNYWLTADREFLHAMGADIEKIPAKEEWIKLLSEQLSLSYQQKKSYCIIWLVDGKPVGHSNVNKIIFGQEAYMHLHLWTAEVRQKGIGTELVKQTIPWFFKNIQLKNLYCEPYALNPAPNKTLKRAGFELVKQYITTPGFLNFEQPANLWLLTGEKFNALQQPDM